MPKYKNFLTRMIVVSFLGILLCIYLLYHHISLKTGFSHSNALCDLGGYFRCSEVAKSKYSVIFGVPVPVYGLWYYLIFLIITSYSFLLNSSAGQRASALFLSCLGFIGAVGAMVFAGISFFVIKALCLFCFLVQLTSFILLFLAYRLLSNLNYKNKYEGLILSSYYWLKELYMKKKLFFFFIILFSSFTYLMFYVESAVAYIVLKPIREMLIGEKVISQIVSEWENKKRNEMQINCDNSVQNVKIDFCLGNLTSNYKLVSFSDLQCPFCKMGYEVVKRYLEKHPNMLYVYKNFPLDGECNERISKGHHRYSCKAAMLARCAGFQNVEAFWSSHNYLFSLKNWDEKEKYNFTRKFSLDLGKLNLCLSGHVLNEVREDVSLGNLCGVTGTPAFFLNGKQINIASLEQLPYVLDEIMRRNVQ